MYIVAARVEALRGRTSKAAEFVVDVRDAWAKATGGTVYSWAFAAGDNLGTYMLSSRVDDMSQHMANMVALGENAEYQELAKQSGDVFTQTVQTRLNRVIGHAGEAGEPHPFLVTSSASIRGSVVAALEWSHQITEMMHEVSGAPITLAIGAAGDFHEVDWIMGYESPQAMEAGRDAIMGNAEVAAALDRAHEFFDQSTARRATIVRMP